MLYDGALRFAAQARAAIERKDIRARREAISRTLAIMSELQGTLDMEKGGAIAASLDTLYVYIIGRFLEAAAKQDVRPARRSDARADDIARRLGGYRSADAGHGTRAAR